jgi:hypothetical protein
MQPEPSLSFMHLLIPVLGLCIPIIAILALFFSRVYSVRQRHLTIREFVRAGQPVPPELLAVLGDAAGSEGWHKAGGGNHQPGRLVLPATVNTGLGLGLMGFFGVLSPSSWLWAIGLVPLLLGLALWVLWAATRDAKVKAHP